MIILHLCDKLQELEEENRIAQERLVQVKTRDVTHHHSSFLLSAPSLAGCWTVHTSFQAQERAKLWQQRVSAVLKQSATHQLNSTVSN